MPVPPDRCRPLNPCPIRDAGDFVLYWMTAFRRPFHNFALQRAVERALALRKPLVILEALRCDYPYASDRLHRFVLDGMADHVRHFVDYPVLYHPYVETASQAGKGLLEALAARACLIVADDYPAFFLPRMIAAAADRVPVLLEAVDANGILPLRAADRAFPTAYAFRRFLQKTLPGHLLDVPLADPLAGVSLPEPGSLPESITTRWPRADEALLSGNPEALKRLPIDHEVPPAPIRGGFMAARETLERFLDARLPLYGERRSESEGEFTSGLSPYLHFGQIGSHEILGAIFAREGWSPCQLSPESRGKRSGWWGLSAAAEAFVDQLVTWRELSFNGCALGELNDPWQALPEWARLTLARHRDDFRPYRYDLQDFAAARTHDPLWNAAQRQLRREGRMHNYLRMLWGKKILEWSAGTEAALAIMLELNDRYALDGRDPNSLSGIGWCLGLYDRAWGPERPIFGTVRYMSSENTARKFPVKGYLARYAPES